MKRAAARRQARSARARVRFHTVSGKLAPTRRAMGAPMVPRPMKATGPSRVGVALLLRLGSLGWLKARLTYLTDPGGTVS